MASNPSVPRDDRHERGRLAQCFCGGQVHGVERPNGFYGEGASDPRKDIARRQLLLPAADLIVAAQTSSVTLNDVATAQISGREVFLAGQIATARQVRS